MNGEKGSETGTTGNAYITNAARSLNDPEKTSMAGSVKEV